MSVQLVQHKSRDFDVTLNFAETENNLSWAFTAENDGEIYEVVLNNVASYTINGVAASITPATPYSVVNETSYLVGITKLTNGQTASIKLKTRRAVSKSIVLNAPAFDDLNTRSEFILLTNNGTNGRVVVTENSNINEANYQGAGVFSSSIIRAIVNLPVLPNLPIQWQFGTHIKLNAINYVAFFAWPVGRNDFWDGKIVVCLINCDTLVVSDLDLNVNNYTVCSGVITGEVYNSLMTYYTSNFITNEVVYTRGPLISKFSFSTRNQTFPFNFLGRGTLDTFSNRSAYFNPIDNYYVGYFGQFIESRGEIYNQRLSKGAYDYIRNGKLGTVNYWGRIDYINTNGEKIGAIDNTSQGGAASLHVPKNNIIFMADGNAYIAFIDQNNQNNFIRSAISNKLHTATIDADYLDRSGLKFCLIGNSVRLHFAFITKEPASISQAYYDLPAIPVSICNDKIKISL